MKPMKKHIFNIAFVVMALALLTPSAWAAPVRTPDSGTTSLLFSMGIAGLVAVRKFVR
jgi:hypothetical protein